MGISGTSPLSGRTLDTFGVGYYFLGVSDVLKQDVRQSAPLRNDQGVELFYNAAITPWIHISPDLQVIDPFEKKADTALVVGLRMSMGVIPKSAHAALRLDCFLVDVCVTSSSS